MPNIEQMTEQEAEIARLEAELGGETEEEVEPKPFDEVVEEPVTTETVEEKPVDVVVDDEKEPAKDDHAAWARLRRERADEKRRADDLAVRLAALESAKVSQPEPKKEVEKAPDPNVDPEGFLAWKISENDKTIKELQDKVNARENQDRQTYAYQAAVNEFTDIVNDFKVKTPDFTQATDFLEAEIRKAVRLENPTIPAAKIQGAVNHKILKIASEFAKQGLNAAEEFYSMAHEFGYKKSAPVVTTEAPQKPKTNLSQIEKTKQRSVSGLNASGASASAGIGLDALSGMTLADFGRLTPEQLRELESQ